MPKNVNIIKAEKCDLTDILEIEHISFQEEGFNKRQFAYLLSKSMFYVAKSERKVWGYIILLQSVRIPKLRLYSIAVHPEARKNHIGQLLLDHAFTRVPKCKKNGIYLEVRQSNTVALRFYEKNGFRRTGIKKAYYPDGENAWVMQWKIDKK